MSFRGYIAETRAKKVFRHYMSLLFQKAGIPVETDNEVEWDGIIDDILTAAREEGVKDE